jgi:3',5'-cyclic AMP phosphodiesterase CpdA
MAEQYGLASSTSGHDRGINWRGVPRMQLAVDMLSIAHLSDPHLDGQQVTHDRLTLVADHLKKLPTQPDLLVVSGDITEPHPGVAMSDEFAWIDSTLRWGPPVLYCPGNSDERAAFRGLLDERGDRWADVGGQAHQVRAVDGVTFLLIDSTVPGEFYGRLRPDSLDWIRATLAGPETGKRAILVMHQPPALLGNPVIDQLRLLDATELESIVAESPAVIATLCGHTHSASATTFGTKPLLVAPGIHSSGQLPLAYTEPNSGLIDESSPPALAIHLVDDRRLTTYFDVLTRPATGDA